MITCKNPALNWKSLVLGLFGQNIVFWTLGHWLDSFIFAIFCHFKDQTLIITVNNQILLFFTSHVLKLLCTFSHICLFTDLQQLWFDKPEVQWWNRWPDQVVCLCVCVWEKPTRRSNACLSWAALCTPRSPAGYLSSSPLFTAWHRRLLYLHSYRLHDCCPINIPVVNTFKSKKQNTSNVSVCVLKWHAVWALPK